MKTDTKGTAVITGASAGIGVIYADRLARRGYDLVLVARDRERLSSVAARLSDETARAIKVVAADLTNKADLAQVEQVLRSDETVQVLVNNAGVGAPARLLDSEVERLTGMIDLNVSALVRLTYAALPAFLEHGGAIINIASVVGIVPELLNGVYGGTKACVLGFSRSLQKEFSRGKIRVQVVLPGATATEFWQIAGTPLEQVPSEMVMKADEMVDAALAGFDRGEFVTIPSLTNIGDWEAYEAARQKLIPNLSLSSPAERYATARLPERPSRRSKEKRGTGEVSK